MVFFEWQAPARYFEKKPTAFFKLVFSLALILSALAYFLGETMLVFVIWVTTLVVCVKAIVPPSQITHKLTKFGIQTDETTVLYKEISAFTMISRPNRDLLRFFTLRQGGEFYLLLPNETLKKKEIISFLQQKIPYIDKVPQTDIEKIAGFLKKLIGL